MRATGTAYKEKAQVFWTWACVINPRQRPTLPPTCAGSTIGGSRLNFRVRNGNGCDPAPMATGKLGAWDSSSVAWRAYLAHPCQLVAPKPKGRRRTGADKGRPRAYCDLMNQSFDRYLEFLSNSINRNIKLPAEATFSGEGGPNTLQSIAFSDHTFTIKRSE